jgi:glyoxylase-like metal-dependent hydrolase (beta-lactamase superfamily II)
MVTLGSLKVVHTPGHTPGHISLYAEQYKVIFGGDFLFKSVYGVEGLHIPPSIVSIDPDTAVVSARRISQLKFDKLLLAHQDSPILEGAREAVEKVARLTIEKTENQLKNI